MVPNRFSYDMISMLRLRYYRISVGSVMPDFAVKFAVRPRFTREERVVGETTPRDRHQWVLNMYLDHRVVSLARLVANVR